jgi:hypothetical protein
MTRLFIVLFRFGLLQVILLAAYHLYLPHHMNWQQGLGETPAMLSWALMTLNNDWSVLVLLWGGLLFVQSFKPEVNGLAKAQSCGVFALYWLIHTTMLVIDPAPIPDQLSWLSVLFVGFAVLQVLLVGVGVRVFLGALTERVNDFKAGSGVPTA